MGKHEIRIRREMMTSRRIERHKNYGELMLVHQKSQRQRKLGRFLVYIAFLLALSAATYYFVEAINDKKENNREQQDPKDLEEIRINMLQEQR